MATRRMKATPEMLRAVESTVDWARQDAVTDEEIDAQIAADPDTAPDTSTPEMTAARVRSVRNRLRLSQNEFCARYHVPLRTLQDWEQARRQPDATALAYLTVIEREPDAAARAHARTAA